MAKAMGSAKFTFFFLILFAIVLIGFAIRPDCPLSSQMTICTPRCTDDSQCSSGTRCCPNICNTKSCSQPNRASSSGGYKGSTSGGTGTYCGNTKCNSYERCEFDKTTKRQKCVRS